MMSTTKQLDNNVLTSFPSSVEVILGRKWGWQFFSRTSNVKYKKNKNDVVDFFNAQDPYSAIKL